MEKANDYAKQPRGLQDKRPVKTFYRVLTPAFDDNPGTIKSWKERKFYTGSHLVAPGSWIERWKNDKSSNHDDYNLEYNGCQYTPKARETFLRFADVKYERLTAEQKYFIGEYEGVAAYDSPQEALNYGNRLNWCVVFEGVELGSLPETAQGGNRVKFVREIDPPMTWEEFKRRYPVRNNGR
ncbi:MAG: hypothetical protein ABSF38_03850 [Verrucomicrobiota bacterium]|jgi:hypothetical protein